MANLGNWRESIRQRLAAAGADILAECENAIIHTEEQILHQRRMLDAMKTEARMQRIDGIKREEEEEKEVLPDEHLSDQEEPSGLEEDGLEPSQVKEEPCTSQGGEQLVLKEETSTSSETLSARGFRGELVREDTCRDASKEESQRKRDRKTGAKGFSCEVCGKGFAYRASYGLHVKTHTKEKPFDCRTCGKMFRRSDKLLLHTRTARSRTFVTSVAKAFPTL
ncbi:zinc finger protein 41 homolog [Nothobranchius furzeri]|uniref:Zinc finger protein 568-like n=1 Tax=Nothobranchius furzeri TaxID=105023 RepID=A0A9D3C2T7_NOTFU|nr:zinc finger protein 568 [Nothobranchius furzeri]KAF7229405.1 zinc finger protein 568-like [Nothobranchius furzeri]